MGWEIGFSDIVFIDQGFSLNECVVLPNKNGEGNEKFLYSGKTQTASKSGIIGMTQYWNVS
ncbi:hypothetical protein C5167_028125 [Papaver somniferum]|nr:hypothetical protein C5167_028125 [Papaver somniferum]